MRLKTLIFYCIFACFSLSVFAQSTDRPKELQIYLQGNEVTKSFIVLREIEFASGDSLSFDDLQLAIEKSIDNLNRLQLFNFIDVETIESADNIEVKFTFQERWYYWGYPILEHSERNLSTFLYYRDISRINYGAAFDWFNFRGRDEMLRFKTRLGFKEHYAISYHKPGFGKRRVDGIWVFADFFRQKKVISSISGNQPVYLQNDDKYLRNILQFGLEYSYRPQINYVLEIGVKLNQYFFNSDFYENNLNGQIRPQLIMPKIGLKYDNRNSIIYPTSGYFINMRFVASLFSNKEFSNNTHLTALIQKNSTIPNSDVFLRNELFVAKYMSDNNKLVLFEDMFNFYGGFYMRGYEYYYFPSDFIFSLKNTLIYKIFDFRLDILPNILPDEFSKAFSIVYLEMFADVALSESVQNPLIVNNEFDHKFAYSVGVGVSMETYYDRLLQFRLAYNAIFNKFGIFAEFKSPLYKNF
ncbi:MAG: BamA/TamA family outer membrane protein [Bacteroidales bacterium]|nr:BamA/TamA family outer membrane protein [Bacteroidales bacterium]